MAVQIMYDNCDCTSYDRGQSPIENSDKRLTKPSLPRPGQARPGRAGPGMPGPGWPAQHPGNDENLGNLIKNKPFGSKTMPQAAKDED